MKKLVLLGMLTLFAACNGGRDYRVHAPYAKRDPVRYVSAESHYELRRKIRDMCPGGYRTLEGPKDINESGRDIYFGRFLCN